MTKKKTGKTRGGKGDGDIAEAAASSGEVLSPSPADGVRVLRQRIEASRAPGRKGERAALSRALSRLAAEYERVLGTTRSAHALRLPGAVSGAERRLALFSNGRPRGTATLSVKAHRQQVNFVPTPPELVNVMLDMAKTTQDDVVYDLGSGDGRIVIAAAAQYGAKGVGIDIDPQRIDEATDRAAKEGVAGRVSFHQVDLFEADIRDATVVMLYLLPALNLEIRPRLLDQLKPGTRIVSHAFDMGDWLPTQKLEVDGRKVYLWTVPDTLPRAQKSALA